MHAKDEQKVRNKRNTMDKVLFMTVNLFNDGENGREGVFVSEFEK